MKKLLALVLVVMMFACCALAETSVNTTADEIELTGDPAAVKVGVVLVGDENEGYTYAHMEGIRTAAQTLGIDPDTQITWKYCVGEDATCYDACADLADAGCNVVFTNSYGHQSYCQQAAVDFPECSFVAMTGDTANAANLDNFSNAFTAVYQSRYLSGAVAGKKLVELVEAGALTDANYDENGNIRVGYVGAYPYAEVVSGYTAFFLGVRSQIENVAMEVVYTNSWFDITAEGTAAEKLMSDGCVIIGQHADSTGAPAAVQAALQNGNVAYSIGYNVDMLSVAPEAALTSATNVWAVYYEYALKCAVNGEPIAKNWSAGYEKEAVAITALGTSNAADDAFVEDLKAKLMSGEVKVFDTASFTVTGDNATKSAGYTTFETDAEGHVTSCCATDTNGDFVADADNAIIDGAYAESYYQSAPSFALRIDGITELTE